jgi:hypothetical protein
MKNFDKIAIVTSVIFLIGCETGMSNNGTTASKTTDKIESGIITKGSTTYSKASVPKSSEIRKLFSKSTTPGYYIQVGYFENKKPNSEFINRMKYSQLPYKIMKKHISGRMNYYALVGPYRSYNQSKKIIGTAKEFVSESAFIVEVQRP